MPGINEEFRLRDVFSDVLDRFINMGKTAADVSDEMASANRDLENTLNDVSRALIDFNTSANAGLESQIAATQAVQDQLFSLNNVEQAYSGVTREMEAQLLTLDELWGTNVQFSDQLSQTMYSLYESGEATSYWTDRIGQLSISALEASQTTEELVAAGYKTADALKDVGEQAEKAAENVKDIGNQAKQAGQAARTAATGGLDQMYRKLKQIAATYLSVKKVVDVLKDAANLELNNLRYRALFGSNELGDQAFDWVVGAANRYRQNINDVASTTTSLLRTFRSGEAVEQLTELAAILDAFTDDYDFKGAVAGIQNAFLTGRAATLARATGINKNLFEQFGISEAVTNSDPIAFANAVSQAFEAAGYSVEAYRTLLDSTASQFSKLTNTIKNGARVAGRAFLDAFQPGLQAFNAFLETDGAARAFSVLTQLFRILGTAASVALQGITKLAEIISNNLEPILLAASIALAAAAANIIALGLAAIVAAAPILAIVFVVSAFLAGISEAGLEAQTVFEGVGLAIQSIATVVAVVAVFIQNLWADLASFFGSVWDDPLASIERLFAGFADTVLGIVETIAKGIDAIIPNSDLASKVAGYRNQVWHYWNENIPGGLDPDVDKWQYDEVLGNLEGIADSFAGLGNFFGNLGDGGGLSSLSGLSLDSLGSVGEVGSVGSIKGDVNIAEESLRYLLDIADRKWIMRFDNRTLRPEVYVEVNALGTSNPREQGQAVADEIAYVLENQFAAHSSRVFSPTVSIN